MSLYGSQACSSDMQLTSLPSSSTALGFTMTTVLLGLCPVVCGPPCCREPCPPLSALTGVTVLQTAHLTEAAPCAYISVMRQQLQTRCPTWLACRQRAGAMLSGQLTG